jgi:NTE family protein
MGKPRVAFVGSGGAAKGVAHLGVLRALEELDIGVDVFIGASTGALVGAFYLQGYRADDMVDWFRPFFQRASKKPRLPLRSFIGAPNAEQLRSPGYLASGLLSIDRLEKSLERLLPNNDFRKMHRSLLVSAADIDGRGRTVFGPGHRDDVPISEAVAASCAMPGLYRAYRIGSRYLVDGEVVRTLSIDLAVEAGADVIVVSNVYRPQVMRPGGRSLVHDGPLAVGRQAFNIILSEKEKRGIDLIHRLYPHVQVLNVSADVGKYSFTSPLGVRPMLTRSYREALRILAAAKRRGVFEVASNVHTVGQA